MNLYPYQSIRNSIVAKKRQINALLAVSMLMAFSSLLMESICSSLLIYAACRKRMQQKKILSTKSRARILYFHGQFFATRKRCYDENNGVENVSDSQKNERHVGFARGHPPYYWPRLALLNFLDRTGQGACERSLNVHVLLTSKIPI